MHLSLTLSLSFSLSLSNRWLKEPKNSLSNAIVYDGKQEQDKDKLRELQEESHWYFYIEIGIVFMNVSMHKNIMPVAQSS